jgi:hypothetical protein
MLENTHRKNYQLSIFRVEEKVFMEDQTKSNRKAYQNRKNPNDHVSESWHEEFERSYEILKAVLNSLPMEKQRKLIELLQIVAEDHASQDTLSSLREKALQIVDTACKNDGTPSDLLHHESERRGRERRQGDRRAYAHNFGSPWCAEHIQILRIMASQNIPLRRIALRLGRTSAAVASKAKELDIPLGISLTESNTWNHEG